VSRRLPALLAAACLLVAAGCGDDAEVVREDPIVITESGGPERTRRGVADPDAGVRIAVVTHGVASSPFWAIVRKGVETARRQMGVTATYEAPDTYSLPRMERLIDEAVAQRPDGLVVSLPEPGLGAAVRRAVRAGVPVVSINSGSDVAARLGVLTHVGQPEEAAGRGAGERLARAGVRRVLCVNQQVGNQGLDDRCAGLDRALRRRGGRSWVLGVDDQDPRTPKRIAGAVRRRDADGVLALNATTGGLAFEGLREAGLAGRVRIGTFDLNPDVLQAVRAGRLAFAVDQQAFLQGYLPVVLLTQRARYGLFPVHGDVLPTGPNFVTRDNASRALELSRRSIR